MEDEKVKRNFKRCGGHFYLVLATILLTTFFTTSCSQLLAYRDDLDKNPPGTISDQTVSKVQYDELARKYQDLLNQSSKMKVVEVAEVKASPELPSNITDGAKKPALGDESTKIDPSELVNKIDSALPDAKAEGVSLDEHNTVVVPAPTAVDVKEVNFTDDVDEQIKQLRDVGILIRANKFENALAILKNLENSKERQVQVRAKMMLGDLLFNQGEYDLAMQVYEEILSKHAFSGLVLKALGKLVACSEKLKLPEKQAKYYSLLHDFFEAG